MNPDGLITIFDMQALDNVKAGDATGLQRLLNDETLPKVKELTCAHKKYAEEFDFLAEVKRVRAAELAADKQTLHERIKAAIQEAVDNPASDLGAISETLTGPERKTRLQQDVLDAIEYVLLPRALDSKLESWRDLKRFEHLECSLYAALSHATMLEKLEHAGIHGRVVAFSETTARLKSISEEAHRIAKLASEELDAFRAAQLTRQQQRAASGQVTKAEAIYGAIEVSRGTIITTTQVEAAIPSLQGSATK